MRKQGQPHKGWKSAARASKERPNATTILAAENADMDILDRMKDLVKQATTERSHYYVASTLVAAMAEIESLRAEIDLMAGDQLDAA